ncbi:MAG TPA: DUF6165 family protein [Gemmataceae bacterium]|nr:DUF6165 family protein [Gemmataceae bacterium]
MTAPADPFARAWEHHQARDYQRAEEIYRRLLRAEPRGARIWFALAQLCEADGRPVEAAACFRQALEIDPRQPEGHFQLGKVLSQQGKFAEAEAAYRRCLQFQADHVAALVNLGFVLGELERHDEAKTCYEQALRHRPDLAEAHHNLGNLIREQGQLDQALAHYDEALELSPDHAEAAWNRALIWLLRGDYERGWPAYEWRWRCKRTTTLPAYTQPRWDGSPLDGRTILLYGEQGLGNTLHFVRYAPLVKARGGRVIVQCQNALLRLLSRTPGIDGLVGWGATPPPFDLWIPLMSLPALFHTTLETIPAAVPYVFPDPDLVVYWRRQLAPVRGFRVGISWQGSPRHAWDRHRSVTLEKFEPLARMDGIRLVSLQKGPGSDQLRAMGGRFPVLSLGELLDEASGPFMDTAAVLANLDLVVCVDSALAHLAGAMGVPAWLALTYTPDWRWLLGRADNLWYPTLRLFRQPTLGDWPGVFRRMAEELPGEMAARPPRQRLYVEVAPGELLDKITILEIKNERITDEAKLRNIRQELAELAAVRQEALPSSRELTELAGRLKAVNERLWEIEDAIRRCEQGQDFGPRFIELARSVYHENDRRAALKRAVNEVLHSRLFEEKSYPGYNPS